jgi:hypothetical protein
MPPGADKHTVAPLASSVDIGKFPTHSSRPDRLPATVTVWKRPSSVSYSWDKFHGQTM